MTDKQKLFVDEYLIDLNATRAYKSVYKNVKSDETAKAAGSRLLTNVNVKEYLDQRMKDREQRTEITQDKVLHELAAIAFANGSDFAKVENGRVVISDTDNLPEEKKKALAGIKMGKNGIEVSTCDKVKALELLGKHLGMWKEKTEVTLSEQPKSEMAELLAQRRERMKNAPE